MPQITNQERLLRQYELLFVARGPVDGMWQCHYLKCPECSYYVYKGPGYDECPCGNISIDSDMLRVSVDISKESDIETFNSKPRRI